MLVTNCRLFFFKLLSHKLFEIKDGVFLQKNVWGLIFYIVKRSVKIACEINFSKNKFLSV